MAGNTIYLPLISRPDTYLLYFDDFSNPNSGWYTGSGEDISAGYSDGEYQLVLWQPHYGWVITRDLMLPSDYRVEVDAREAQNATSYGLMFGIQWGAQSYEGYQILVYPRTQEYLLEKRDMDRSWTTLIDWTVNSVIRPDGGTNHLRVDRIGTLIYLYINGTLVATLTDGSFTGFGRDAGVRLYSYDEAPVDVRFDNFGAYRTP